MAMWRPSRGARTDHQDTVSVAAGLLDAAHLQHGERRINATIECLLHLLRARGDARDQNRVRSAGALWIIIRLVDPNGDGAPVSVGRATISFNSPSRAGFENLQAPVIQGSHWWSLARTLRLSSRLGPSSASSRIKASMSAKVRSAIGASRILRSVIGCHPLHCVVEPSVSSTR